MHCLGIDGIDLVAVTQQIINQQPAGGFQRHQHRGRIRLMLGNLRVERRKALRTMGNLALGQRRGRVIGAAHVMMIIGPINTKIQHMYDLYFRKDCLQGHERLGLVIALSWLLPTPFYGSSMASRGMEEEQVCK